MAKFKADNRGDQPVPVSTATPGFGRDNVAALALGVAHSCGLTTAGAVFCWGGNDWGQLGTGTGANHLVPTAVAFP